MNETFTQEQVEDLLYKAYFAGFDTGESEGNYVYWTGKYADNPEAKFEAWLAKNFSPTPSAPALLVGLPTQPT